MATGISTALQNMGSLALGTPPLPKPPGLTPQTMAAPTGIAPLADESVTNQFTRITQAGGPLMKMATQSGLNLANKRGLVNSSMAVGSAHAETYKAALPLAQQEAQTAANRGLAEADRTGQMERLRVAGDQSISQITKQGEVQTGLQAQDNAAQAARLQTGLSADMARLDKQIASTEGQQKLELQGQKERLEISGRLEMERLTKAAELDRQRVSLQGQIESVLSAQGATQAQELQKLQGAIQTALQTQADGAAMERMKLTFDQNVALQQGDNAAQIERIKASGDQQIRTLITQQEGSLKELSMSLAAQDKAKIAELTVAIFEKEAAMRAALLANPDMPAAERAAYERAISSMGDPARAYLNALYTPPPPAGGAPGGIAPPIPPAPVVTAPEPAGIAPTAPAGSPLAGQPVVDHGPTAGLVYNNGKFFDPVTGAQVDPKTYTPPAAQPAAAAPAPVAVPTTQPGGIANPVLLDQMERVRRAREAIL